MVMTSKSAVVVKMVVSGRDLSTCRGLTRGKNVETCELLIYSLWDHFIVSQSKRTLSMGYGAQMSAAILPVH